MNTQQHVTAREVGLAEGRELLDAAARRWLDMSGDDFVAAYERGDFDADDRFPVQQVASYLPFARA